MLEQTNPFYLSLNILLTEIFVNLTSLLHSAKNTYFFGGGKDDNKKGGTKQNAAFTLAL